MEDITPGLLEKIQKQFYHDIEKEQTSLKTSRNRHREVRLHTAKRTR